MSEQHSDDKPGQGFWLNSKSYEKIAGLPVISAIRAVTANVIRQNLAAGPAKVLSLGIGTGALYKEFFQKELLEGSLELHGVDILESMIAHCKEELHGPNIHLCVGDVCNFDKFIDQKFDVIEAGLVLHHILRFEDLGRLVAKIQTHLNENGSFVIGDIDVECGEYIENKLDTFERVHGKLSVDLQSAQFFNDQIRLPIFTKENAEDQNVIRELERISCTPLVNEVESLPADLKVKLKPLILMNVESAKKGLEWHRAVNSPRGWKKLIEKNFPPAARLHVFLPAEIRGRFPEVLDNPFVLIAKR